MTPADILAIAAKHGAYPDCTPTLRGEEAIVTFAREVLQSKQQARVSRPADAVWHIDPNTDQLVITHV